MRESMLYRAMLECSPLIALFVLRDSEHAVQRQDLFVAYPCAVVAYHDFKICVRDHEM